VTEKKYLIAFYATRCKNASEMFKAAKPERLKLESSSSSFIRHNKVRNIKLTKQTVGKTYQADRALTVAFN